jgi:hypothetical protein
MAANVAREGAAKVAREGVVGPKNAFEFLRIFLNDSGRKPAKRSI